MIKYYYGSIFKENQILEGIRMVVLVEHGLVVKRRRPRKNEASLWNEESDFQ